MKNYDMICILEGTIRAENMKAARRALEDTIYAAFDNVAAKDANPCIMRMRFSVGGEGSISCVHTAVEDEMRACYLEEEERM